MKLKYIFIALLIITIVALLIINQNQVWNDGYCINCGTKYEAISRSNTETYYECPNCRFGLWY